MSKVTILGQDEYVYYSKDHGVIKLLKVEGFHVWLFLSTWKQIREGDELCAVDIINIEWILASQSPGNAFVVFQHLDDSGRVIEEKEFKYTVIKLSMDVDANRDGQVQVNEEGKFNWVWARGHPGAVLLVNNDREENELNLPPGKHSEFAEVHIRPTGVSSLPAGYSIKLFATENAAKRFSVYRNFNGKLERILGLPLNNSTEDIYDYSPPLNLDGEILYMEAREFPDSFFEGLITLELHLIFESPDEFYTYGFDKVVFRVAPWLMTPNTQPAIKVFAVELKDQEGKTINKEFLCGLEQGCIQAGVQLNIINGEDYKNDPWIQDEIEFGYCESPGHIFPVVFDSPRDRELGAFAEKELLGPDFGHFQIGGSSDNSLDSFGNLEVSPPVEVNGKKYHFGRIIFGGIKYKDYSRYNRQMMPEIRKFLYAQKVQSPFEIYTDWLEVGHVDEIVCFISDSNEKGFLLLIASPAKCFNILKRLSNSGHGDSFLLKDRMRGRPDSGEIAQIKIKTLLENNKFWDYNKLCQDYINFNKRILQKELELKHYHIVDIPVLFKKNEADERAVAFFPNMVNHLVLGEYSIVPKPYGPKINGKDEFEEDFKKALPNRQVIFIEDWYTYHEGHGEVHCGSNTQRQPFKENHWWEYLPDGGFNI